MTTRRLRVVQVAFVTEAAGRDADALLDAWPTFGGAAAGVARAGVEVTLVVAAAQGATRERDGVRLELVPPRALVDRVAAIGADVVHVHGFRRPLAVRRLAQAVRGTPLLVQDHGSRVPRLVRRAAWRWTSRDVAGVAFTARDQATPWLRAGALRRGVAVFEVVEGSSPFAPGARDEARRATGIHGDPALLWTGHLDANKDPLTVLAALERAAPSLPDARLWCCFARAPLRDAVERRIAGSPALRGRVHLLGRRPHAEMERCFRAADLFVQASHHEGSGYSVIEALSCGTPAVVTDIPSFRRIVGDAGSLTPVGDAGAMARAIVDWARRDQGPTRAAARARFAAALSWDAVGRELRAAYDALVEAQ